GDDQLVLRVQRDVVPAVPLAVVGRVIAVAGGLLLGDERPLLTELALGREGGKPPRVRRGRRGRARPRSGCSARPCWGRPGGAVRSAARRSPRRRAPTPTRPSPGEPGV